MAFRVVVYLIPGVMDAAMWGWSLEVPVTLEFPREAIGAAMTPIEDKEEASSSTSISISTSPI